MKREILKLRKVDGFTLEECGEVFRYTRERIRQIEAKAIRKLHDPSNGAAKRLAVAVDRALM